MKQVADLKEVVSGTSGGIAHSGFSEPAEDDTVGDAAATPEIDVRDQDVPYQKPGREWVDTQSTTEIKAGDIRFEVHCMTGVVPGQVLSIGWEGIDLEHFTVKKLGSIFAENPFQYAHAVRSPVRIVRSSNGGPPGDARSSQANVPTATQGRRQRNSNDSDVESEVDERVTNVVTNRRVNFPTPYPTGYKDVPQWDNLLLTHISMGNPDNMRREKQYWEKAYKWKSNDPRLSERETPKDMIGVDMIIRQKIKELATSHQPYCKGLLESMKAKEDAWWAARQDLLPARQLLAMFYENFRIDAPAQDAMAIADFNALGWSSFGEKLGGLEAFWEAFKRASAAVSHLMTAETITGQLVEKLTPAKVIAEEMKEFKRLHHSEWTYDIIADIMRIKIEERATVARTKLQRDEHAKTILDTLQGQVNGKPRTPKDGVDPNKKQNANQRPNKNQSATPDAAPAPQKAKQDKVPLTPEQKKERNAKKKANEKLKKAAKAGKNTSDSEVPPVPTAHDNSISGRPPRKVVQVNGSVSQLCYYYQSWWHSGTGCLDVIDPKRGCKFTHDQAPTLAEFKAIPVPAEIKASQKKTDKAMVAQGLTPPVRNTGPPPASQRQPSPNQTGQGGKGDWGGKKGDKGVVKRVRKEKAKAKRAKEKAIPIRGTVGTISGLGRTGRANTLVSLVKMVSGTLLPDSNN